MVEKRAYIFHGLGSTKYSNWFVWLAYELKKRGFKVKTPQFPNTIFPKLHEWLAAVDAFTFDENTIIVGHSLGGILTLRYLEQHDVKVGKVYLVSVPVTHLGWGQLISSHFFDTEFQWNTIRSRAEEFFVVSDTRDPVVPLEHGDILAKNLHCNILPLEDGSHFCRLTFPELLKIIDANSA